MAKPSKPCPICEKPAVSAYAPFCSDRCKQVDLNRWLDGSYAIPAVELDDPDLDELADAMREDATSGMDPARRQTTKH